MYIQSEYKFSEDQKLFFIMIRPDITIYLIIFQTGVGDPKALSPKDIEEPEIDIPIRIFFFFFFFENHYLFVLN